MLQKPDYCRPCPLYGNGLGFSVLEGDGSSGLMVVAESLGKSEDKDGLPLRPYAKSGEVYQRCADDVRSSRETATLTNILRCRPPGNELLGKPYERAAIDRCEAFMAQAVSERQPQVILALGAVPLRELATEPYAHLPQAAMRGFILPSKYGIPLVATYHPSLIARGAWNLYGVMLNDHTLARRIAADGIPERIPTQYELNPTLARVREYLAFLGSNPLLPLSYDVETAHILGEVEPDDWRQKRIVQIQFSHRSGFAIVLPWDDGPFTSLAKDILALSNPKWGWNSRLSDDLVLGAQGAILNGETHDLMLAWGHLQPDFAGGGDGDDDKGIPARLMGLQACASFFCPEEGPWKHESRSDIKLYGAKDADYTLRCGNGIFRHLSQRGLLSGYTQYKYRQRFVLDNLGARGLPVDRARQQALATYVNEQMEAISAAIQKAVPMELRSIHPKGVGYKTLSKKLKAIVENGYDPNNPPLIEKTSKGVKIPLGHLVQENDIWMVRLLFNVNSSQQLAKYINHMGYPMPKHITTGKDTTNALGLEQLLRTTNDEVLKLTQQDRKLTKIGGTYAKGSWVPGPDGRVHSTFGMLTGSGQTTSKDPNVQQYPEHYDPKLPWLKTLMQMVKGAIKAEPGRVLVKVDMRGFHARMQGHLAEDPIYYRMADFDLHSFTTAHYLGLPIAPQLQHMSDEELRPALKAIKNEYSYDRNFKIKRCTYLMQFSGGPDKMFSILQPAFVSVIEVIELTEKVKKLFPRTFDVFPKKVRKMLAGCRIVSPFGCHRFIFDRKIQEGVAFLPSNQSHCHIQSAMIRLDDQGVLAEYDAVNFCHDAVWLHPKESQVDEAIRAVKAEFERPSEILINSLGAFFCHSDSQVGPDMNSVEDYHAA